MQKYAVVDIEATNTDIHKGKMIQFSCQFIEKGRCTEQFNTYINPEIPLSTEVQELTGITSKQVQQAPLFTDMAPIFIYLLEDCTFVAHNARFDFQFLNAKLEEEGFAPLTIPVIDTLELAEVLYPCAPSYRLFSLAQYLDIEHEHPHQADSDAKATALLFLKLVKKFQKLAAVTQKQISKFQTSFYKETGAFLASLAEQTKSMKRADLKIIGPLAVQKEVPSIFVPKAESTPTVALPQENMVFSYGRAEQRTLYEQVWQADQASIFIIPEQASARWEQAGAFVLHAVTEYIDIQKFRHSLYQEESETLRLLQLKLLVWLSETKTGYLKEVNMRAQPKYIEKIRHRGLATLSRRQLTYPFDFVVRQQTQQRVAQSAKQTLVVTQEKISTETFDFTPYQTLVLVSATYFLALMHERARHELNLAHFLRASKKIQAGTAFVGLRFANEKQERKWKTYEAQLRRHLQRFYLLLQTYYEKVGQDQIDTKQQQTLAQHIQKLSQCLQQGLQKLQKTQNKKTERLIYAAPLQYLQYFIDALYVYNGGSFLGLEKHWQWEGKFVQPVLIEQSRCQWEYYFPLQKGQQLYCCDTKLSWQGKNSFGFPEQQAYKQEQKCSKLKIQLFFNERQADPLSHMQDETQRKHTLTKWVKEQASFSLSFPLWAKYRYLLPPALLEISGEVSLALWQKTILATAMAEGSSLVFKEKEQN